MTKTIICRIALAIPLHKQFDYLLPEYLAENYLQPESLGLLVGCRVRVPFGGKRQMVGIICEVNPELDYDVTKLKKVTQLIDRSPLLNDKLWSLLRWASFYYQHPFGDVYQQAIPTTLRQGKEAAFKGSEHWQLNSQLDKQSFNLDDFKRAKKQHQALEYLGEQCLSTSDLKAHGITRVTLKALQEKEILETLDKQPAVNLNWIDEFKESTEKPNLTSEQALAITAVNQQNQSFNCFLLEGITGSGKTEVYLNVINNTTLSRAF